MHLPEGDACSMGQCGGDVVSGARQVGTPGAWGRGGSCGGSCHGDAVEERKSHTHHDATARSHSVGFIVAHQNRTISTVVWVHRKLPQMTVKAAPPSNETTEIKTGYDHTSAMVP